MLRAIQSTTTLPDPDDPPAAAVQHARFHVEAGASLMPLAGVDERVATLSEDQRAEPSDRIRDRLILLQLDPDAHSYASYG